mmetsp:Transcript_36580/g.54540  ORF Transcript_36580/g.54540 Transcript_36580/m.54540 type:complete len:87 (+) Transcript_36580:36-296(+)
MCKSRPSNYTKEQSNIQVNPSHVPSPLARFYTEVSSSLARITQGTEWRFPSRQNGVDKGGRSILDFDSMRCLSIFVQQYGLWEKKM